MLQQQLQNRSRKSWKWSLNLCSPKWLSKTRNLVSSLIPWGLCTFLLLALGLINLRICFLKVLTDSKSRMLLSSLFHSIRVDGKEILSLTLLGGMWKNCSVLERLQILTYKLLMIPINSLKNLLCYKAHQIETSQSIPAAYQLTGLHMKTSLYQEVSLNRL